MRDPTTPELLAFSDYIGKWQAEIEREIAPGVSYVMILHADGTKLTALLTNNPQDASHLLQGGMVARAMADEQGVKWDGTVEFLGDVDNPDKP